MTAIYLQEIHENDEALTHEELLRDAYSAQYMEALNPPHAGNKVDYDAVRAELGNTASTDLQISIHANTDAVVEAQKRIAQQVNVLILCQAITAEKLAMLETRFAADGFQQEGRKVVARVMASHQLRSGRVVPHVPFRSSRDIEKVLSVKRHIQKLSVAILANIPWDKANFVHAVRDVILHPDYVATARWSRSSK